MKIDVDIPEYSQERGLRMVYEDDYLIQVEAEKGVVVINADRGGLITLARWFLTLAQDSVPSGRYLDLDEWSGAESGSRRLYIVKRGGRPVPEK